VKKILKWTGFVIAGIAGALLLGIAYVYFASSRVLDRNYSGVDHAQLVVPTGSAEIAEGRRIAQLAGCLHCHGENLSGGLVDDIPNLVRLVAPNISVMLPEYSNAQLVTMLRKGVNRDGRSVLFMPSEMYRHLRDEDIARLIAYLRTVPPTPEGSQEKTEVRIIGRALLAFGEIKPSALAIENLPPALTDASVTRGRNQVMAFCSECHGQSLEGFAPIQAPPLSVAKGYSLAQFTRLLQEGVAIGDRPLPLMGQTSRARFVALAPEEIGGIYEYLQSRQ
jgi:cytochrome c553